MISCISAQVDEYPYDDMKMVDSFMTDLLCGLWLSISAIIMLNLLIALMSDTFQRVYDNAQVSKQLNLLFPHAQVLNFCFLQNVSFSLQTNLGGRGRLTLVSCPIRSLIK